MRCLSARSWACSKLRISRDRLALRAGDDDPARAGRAHRSFRHRLPGNWLIVAIGAAPGNGHPSKHRGLAICLPPRDVPRLLAVPQNAQLHVRLDGLGSPDRLVPRHDRTLAARSRQLILRRPRSNRTHPAPSSADDQRRPDHVVRERERERERHCLNASG
jgi:hypothetical protein